MPLANKHLEKLAEGRTEITTGMVAEAERKESYVMRFEHTFFFDFKSLYLAEIVFKSQPGCPHCGK